MNWGIAETASEIKKIKSESADYLNWLYSCGVIDWNVYNYAFDFYEVLLMKAYEQGRKDAQLEPCEDAISRQRLLNDLKELITVWGKYPVMAEQIKGVETAIGYVETIPSVTPKRKTGKWIDAQIGDLPVQVCDQCNTFFPLAYTGGGHHYCPNCGADMRGEQDG